MAYWAMFMHQEVGIHFGTDFETIMVINPFRIPCPVVNIAIVKY